MLIVFTTITNHLIYIRWFWFFFFSFSFFSLHSLNSVFSLCFFSFFLSHLILVFDWFLLVSDRMDDNKINIEKPSFFFYYFVADIGTEELWIDRWETFFFFFLSLFCLCFICSRLLLISDSCHTLVCSQMDDSWLPLSIPSFFFWFLLCRLRVACRLPFPGWLGLGWTWLCFGFGSCCLLSLFSFFFLSSFGRISSSFILISFLSPTCLLWNGRQPNPSFHSVFWLGEYLRRLLFFFLNRE